jgi:hypothetical protein
MVASGTTPLYQTTDSGASVGYLFVNAIRRSVEHGVARRLLAQRVGWCKTDAVREVCRRQSRGRTVSGGACRLPADGFKSSIDHFALS